MTDTFDDESPTVTYDPETGTYSTRYDRSSTPPSVTVVTAIESITGADPSQLPPLQTVIPTDALDKILEREPDDSTSSAVTVTFSYAGFEVTVHNGGHITLFEEP